MNFTVLQGASLAEMQEKLRQDSIRMRGGVPISQKDLKGNQTQCPSCCKIYERAITKEQWESGKYQGKIESEQWQSGICSDACWNKFLGME